MLKANLHCNSKVPNSLIYYIICYLITTQIAYIYMYYGDYSNMINTLLYTSINYICLILGFLPNWKIKIRKKEYSYSDRIEKVIFYSAIATCITSLNNVFSIYSDFSIIPQLLNDPGEAYEYVKFLNRNEVIMSTSILESFMGVTLNILAFTKYIFSGFSLIYWGQIKNKVKYLVLITIIIYFFQTFLIGAMINLGSLFLSLFPFLLYKIQEKRYNIKTKINTILLIIVFGLLLLYFLGSRNFFELDNSNTNILVSGFLGVLFYISHGYVGLSSSINLPFEFTFGQTIFRGLFNTVAPYFNITNLFDKSYLMRNEVENGWSALQNWSTIFPWLASDITFWLIPVVMFFLGYIMKKGWKISFFYKNPFALAFIGQLCILCFMIPANNQLFHTFSNGVGAIIILLFYLKSIKNSH